MPSNNRLLTTLAYRLNGEPTYALEGSIFIAGAAVQWLRDGLGILENAAQSGALADSADAEQDVVLVPAFTGLGALHWDSEARGAIFWLTRTPARQNLPARAGGRVLPNQRSADGDEGGLGGCGSDHPAGRRWNDRQRLDHAGSG